VILTLVLLGQLLEARAHSQTSGAIKIVEINNRSHFGHRRTDKVISIHDIKGDLLSNPVIKFCGWENTDGESTIDESMISGEPIPVDKKSDDPWQNHKQSFVMIAVGSETLLSANR
jgi:Cu2+-exporting ATPase